LVPTVETAQPLAQLAAFCDIFINPDTHHRSPSALREGNKLCRSGGIFGDTSDFLDSSKFIAHCPRFRPIIGHFEAEIVAIVQRFALSEFSKPAQDRSSNSFLGFLRF
jgi:hypothetical protein